MIPMHCSILVDQNQTMIAEYSRGRGSMSRKDKKKSKKNRGVIATTGGWMQGDFGFTSLAFHPFLSLTNSLSLSFTLFLTPPPQPQRAILFDIHTPGS